LGSPSEPYILIKGKFELAGHREKMISRDIRKRELHTSQAERARADPSFRRNQPCRHDELGTGLLN
jgi:hypothetical protein